MCGKSAAKAASFLNFVRRRFNYIHSFIHSSLFAQKFQYNTTKSKRTELDEKVVKH